MGITKVESLKGLLNSKTESLRGTIQQKSEVLKGSIQTDTIPLKGTVHVLNINEEYNGEYTVIPKIKEQTLHTIDKVMSKDMVISPIPCFEVQNEKGGNTITIGG